MNGSAVLCMRGAIRRGDVKLDVAQFVIGRTVSALHIRGLRDSCLGVVWLQVPDFLKRRPSIETKPYLKVPVSTCQ